MRLLARFLMFSLLLLLAACIDTDSDEIDSPVETVAVETVNASSEYELSLKFVRESNSPSSASQFSGLLKTMGPLSTATSSRYHPELTLLKLSPSETK